MTETTWRIWRHKKRPEIRYYVETEPTAVPEWQHALGMRRFYKIADQPKEYQGKIDPKRPDCYLWGLVRLRSTGNLLYDWTDYPPHMAPEAGLWPRAEFEALYEPEEGAP